MESTMSHFEIKGKNGNYLVFVNERKTMSFMVKNEKDAFLILAGIYSARGIPCE